MPPPTYPPYQLPLVDPHSGRVAKAWHLFFLSLVGAADVAGAIAPGSITYDQLQSVDAPALLGRGSPGLGAPEPIMVGAGLALTGTTLALDPATVATSGYWTPITNGDPVSPEILFDSNGDCIVGFVPTP
jgi:hypothetical protein